MAAKPVRQMQPVAWSRVRPLAGWWSDRLAALRGAGLPAIHRHLEQTGRLEAFALTWQPGDPNPPHIFWDSDVAKWLEGAACALALAPDDTLAAQVNRAVELICRAQQPDGYLNVHFTVVRPEARWTNLRDWHELYCAGHLLEAAIALDEGLGDRRLLTAMERYVALIAQVFGTGPGQKRGYPGHQELELALVRLYRHTGSAEALALAQYFIDQRGQSPHYWKVEAEARGESVADWPEMRLISNQAHQPVREQTTAVGHAVRAMYLYSAMADLAAETGDASLREACQTLWQNVTQRRMYVTGGLGSTREGERFTHDWDLPNETAYAETCAAIGLVFWAHRMLQMEAEGAYADVLELALYNGVMSGVSLAGTHFFYANPLRVDPQDYRAAYAPHRQDWFNCACCPTNLARLLPSLGTYAASFAEREGSLHLFLAGVYDLPGGRFRVETRYPMDGQVTMVVEAAPAESYTLAVRRPAWSPEVRYQLNGEPVDPPEQGGYARFTRRWAPGDRLTLDLAMPAQRCWARPEVVANVGRVALRRGPLVYCLEEVDNGPALDSLVLPAEAEIIAEAWPDALGGTVALRAAGWREVADEVPLYGSTAPVRQPCELVAIPYALWQNRGEGEMAVWIRSAP